MTALQLGDSAEGARVTIVSDSALNDYEAFRRGDRFYVKIPQADFSAGNPTFRGNGFEDVRVQEVGDSVIVSFKLQPGATARVDQRSNRLDVIFSAVGTSRSVVPVNVAKSYPTSRNRRNASDSEASAGPAPPISSTPSRESRSSDYTEVETYSGTSYRDAARASTSNRNRRAVTQSGAAQENRRGNTGANSASTNSTSPTSPPTTTTPQPTPYGSNTAATECGDSGRRQLKSLRSSCIGNFQAAGSFELGQPNQISQGMGKAQPISADNRRHCGVALTRRPPLLATQRPRNCQG